ncbi:MAG: peptidylprolyl isomerase [Planctomycetes bacterium]|nr:peptidylprolyl isomerase [Planctomycetota bacterium]
MSTYKNKVAVIDTSKGRIIIKFYPKEAPNTVQNFASLADQEFYDGLIFHRVIKGFMIQGGCPLGTGTGGPGWQIDAEFSAIKHEPGTVSMARSQDPNSAGSQFFICLERTPHLDGKYTAFGQVIKGMDVVKAIGDVKTDAKDRPVDEVKIFKVRIMSKDDAEKLGAE